MPRRVLDANRRSYPPELGFEPTRAEGTTPPQPTPHTPQWAKKEGANMYIGVGTVVLILIILLLVGVLR